MATKKTDTIAQNKSKKPKTPVKSATELLLAMRKETEKENEKYIEEHVDIRTPGEILHNIRNWSFKTLGAYSMSVEEMPTVVRALERDNLRRTKTICGINRCPCCKKEIDKTDCYCRYCGKKLREFEIEEYK